jgi:hypothetical protein
MTTLRGYKRDSESLFIDKDPDAILQYTFDWTDWLASGETISTVDFEVETITGDATPLTKSGVGTSGAGKKCEVTLAGGTAGNIYTVYNTITTDQGETERKFFRIVCKNRSF